MTIRTTEEAEDFLAREGVRARVDKDLVMVNSVVAAVAMGTSRAKVQRRKKALGITDRCFFISALRKSFLQDQCQEKS